MYIYFTDMLYLMMEKEFRYVARCKMFVWARATHRDTRFGYSRTISVICGPSVFFGILKNRKNAITFEKKPFVKIEVIETFGQVRGTHLDSYYRWRGIFSKVIPLPVTYHRYRISPHSGTQKLRLITESDAGASGAHIRITDFGKFGISRELYP